MNDAPFNLQARDASQIAADAIYARDQARLFCERFGNDIAGQRVLEIGPGINFGANLILTSYGAECLVADRFLAPWDDGYHPSFYTALADLLGASYPPLEQAIAQNSYDGLLTLVCEPVEALTSIPSQSIDKVFSNAVLEHVLDLDTAARELFRVSKPGAQHSHGVDFRDHKDFSHPLEYMLLSEADWLAEREATHCERGTRLRAPDAERAFRAAGFSMSGAYVNCEVEADYLAGLMPRLKQSASPHRDMSEADLRVLGMLYRVERPLV